LLKKAAAGGLNAGDVQYGPIPMHENNWQAARYTLILTTAPQAVLSHQAGASA